MKWNYRCPICGEWQETKWSPAIQIGGCRKSPKKSFAIPSPKSQPEAFVDEHDPPEEMKAVVLATKGLKCTVPGCTRPFEELDHRIPYGPNGRTSVNNLWPMCSAHNKSKGDTNYAEWLEKNQL